MSVRVGDWCVEPSLNLIRRGDEEIRLRPKVMDVLMLLAASEGRVVSREEIIDRVWAKEFVADSVLASAISELRAALGDQPGNPRYVETVPKRGYRLMVQVSAPPAPPAAEDTRPTDRGVPRRRAWRLAAGAAGLIVALGLLLVASGFPGGRRGAGPSGRVRLAVLPFESLGPEALAYVARGLGEEVTARLASVGGLAVLASGATVAYAASPLSLPELGRRLQADYLLTGSVRWQGNGGGAARARISVRLVRVSDGVNVWAETYERRAGEVLGVQGEIARQVAGVLGLAVGGDVRSSLERLPTGDPEAYEAYLRGLYHAANTEGEESQRLGASMFARAVQLDPEFLLAWAELARLNALLVHFGFDRSAERQDAARAAANRVEALSPGGFEAYMARGRVRAEVELDFEGAAASYAAAARLRPDDAVVSASLGDVQRRRGRFDLAREDFARAVRLSPGSAWLGNELAVTESVLGRFAEAEAGFLRSIALAPDQHTAHEWRAYNTLLWTGDVTAAVEQLDAAPVSLRPSVVLARWRFALLRGDTAAALSALADLPAEVTALQSHFLPRALLLAQTYRLMGYHDTAGELFEEARLRLVGEAEERPDDARVRAALAVTYAGLGQRTLALESTAAAATLWPPGRDAIRNACRLEMLARTHVLLGELDEAVARLVELGRGPVPPYAAPLVDLDPFYAPVCSHPAYPTMCRPLVSGAVRHLQGGDPLRRGET